MRALPPYRQPAGSLDRFCPDCQALLTPVVDISGRGADLHYCDACDREPAHASDITPAAHRTAQCYAAIHELKEARELLRLAGAQSAYRAVCRALESAYGAARHAELREDRERVERQAALAAQKGGAQ